MSVIGPVLLQAGRRGELVEELGQTCLAEPGADGGEARTQLRLVASTG